MSEETSVDEIFQAGFKAAATCAGMTDYAFYCESFSSENEQGDRDFHILIGMNLAHCDKGAIEKLCSLLDVAAPDGATTLRERYLGKAKETEVRFL